MTGNGQASKGQKIIVVVDEELRDLIPGYLEHRRKDIVEIRAALDRGDFETIRMTGHKMKGSGGGYGFDRITDIGRAMEEGAKGSDAQEIRLQIEALEEYLDCVDVVYES